MKQSLPCSAPLGLLLPLLALLGTAASCATPQLAATPRYGLAMLDGDFLAESAALPGTSTRTDLDDLGLDDREGIPGARLDFKFGVPHLVVQGGQSSYSGSGVVTGQLSIAGLVVPITGPVQTDLDFATYSGLLLFDVVPSKTVDVGIGIGVTLLDFDFGISQGANAINSDETLPVPVLAGNVEVELGPFEIALLVSGMSVSIDDNKGSLYDADGFVRWSVFGGDDHLRTSIVLGWRQTNLDVEYDDGGDNFEAEIGMSGPYLGVQFAL